MVSAAIDLLGEEPKVDLEALEAPPHKIVAEAAMLLRAVRRVPADVSAEMARSAEALASRLIPHARSTRVLVGIALHPPLALDYAAAHIVLSSAGWPDAGFDGVLRSSLNANGTGRERVPHRELEQAWLRRLAGDPPQESIQSILPRTALGTGVDVLFGTRDDVYALTHALLYATDFGGRLPPLPRADDEILSEAQSALAGALDDDDYDLAGELLLAWRLLAADTQPVPSFAFRVLAAVEDEVGFLPSLAIDGEGYERHPADARREYVTATTYHTAFVMGLLCAVALRRPETGPGPTDGRTAPPEAVAALLAELEDRETQPQWLKQLGRLPEEHQGALAPLVRDVALRRAARRLDLVALRRVLALSLEARITPSPAALQAARMVGRLARTPLAAG
jgi:hypothetical protein